MRKTKLLARSCLLLGFCGVIGFSSGSILNLWGDELSSPLRGVDLPLTEVADAKVDSQGRVYVALMFYCRIQVYDRDGNFLFGVHIPTGGGDFQIAIDGSDQIKIAPRRERRILTMTRDGQILDSIDDPDTVQFQQLDNQSEGYVHPRTGDRVEVRGFPICTVVKSSRGHPDVRISTSVLLYPIAGPLPAWLLIWGIPLGLHLRRKHKENTPKD